MGRNRLTGYSVFILLFLILAAAAPFLLWQMKEESPVRVVLSAPGSLTDERKRLLTWPFFHAKIAMDAGSGLERPASLMYLAAPVYRDEDDGVALLEADRVKSDGIGNGLFLSDRFCLSEAVHPLYRDRLEDFLGIRDTGWVVLYEREPRTRLTFRREGEAFVLEPGLHFSGKPPEARYRGRRAPVYTWIPVYGMDGEGRVTSDIDLHLTEEGEKIVQGKGLPSRIPLTMEAESPLAGTAFFAVEIPPGSVATGTFRLEGKEAYLSRFSLFFPDSSGWLYWRIYVPWLRDQISRAASGEGDAPRSAGDNGRFAAEDGMFCRISPAGGKEPFYIKGVNLGPALPGTWFTQFSENEHLYYSWFAGMGGMNLNTVRVYTLLPPSFYRAFRKYNEDNPHNPLYLIQEIWPEEHPAGNNYLEKAYRKEYEKEIERTVDALHGKGSVQTRKDRAWGEFRDDVSPWVLAYLIGRELEPDEVLDTNRLNEGTVYEGRFVSAPEGPAVESWLAASCDWTVSYETDRYGTGHPVGIVSWPILDRKRHPVEWNDPELQGRAPANDKAVVDINRLTVEDGSFGGLFGAYHIYPNYPDFMNNQSSYGEYKDAQGVFRYGGYLAEFMENHTAYPALVAEYGLSTSASTAHFNPDGYHHGGLTEEEQARGIIRMTEAIRREGYAGGLIFEWIDEWAKKTWTTEPFMVPYDRQALWHNALDPEQNYGLIAMRAASRRGSVESSSERTGMEIGAWGSEAYLYLALNRPGGWGEEENLYIGLDTYDRLRGIFSFPVEGGEVPSGLEALVRAEPLKGDAVILTAEDYGTASPPYGSTKREGQEFRPVEILVNRAYLNEEGKYVPPLYETPGRLRRGSLDEAAFSFDRDGDRLVIRIPWGAVNVSDPSEGTVLDDMGEFLKPPERDQINTSPSESILVYLLVADGEGRILARLPAGQGEDYTPLEYRWEAWDVPTWVQTKKKSVVPLTVYFAGL